MSEKKNPPFCPEIVLPTFSIDHCFIQIGGLHNGSCKDGSISKLIWRQLHQILIWPNETLEGSLGIVKEIYIFLSLETLIM